MLWDCKQATLSSIVNLDSTVHEQYDLNTPE